MTQTRTTLVYSMFALMLVLAALDQTILGTALPVIARELHGESYLSWVFSAYLIASTVVIPLYGKTADVYGRKPMLLTAISLFLLGSLACGFSQSMAQLIIARGIQGAGGGGLMTLTMLSVVDLYPEQSRGKYQGLLGASYGIATMFGPLLGGLLVEKLSWHWAFFINVPGALAALFILGASLRGAPERKTKSVDFLGAGLLAAALVTTLLATQSEAAVVDGMWNTWVLALFAVILTVLFAWVQRYARNPILPLTLFADPVFSAVTAISVASGVALFSVVVFLPTYLQTALLKSPMSSAWHLFPLMFGITLSAVVGGKILRSDGPLRILALGGSVVMLLSFCTLALVFTFFPNNAFVFSACMFPLGLGIGVLFPLVTIVSQRTAPREHMGIGTALPIMVRALGGAIGVAVLGSVMAHRMANQLGAQSTPEFLRRTAAQGQAVAHDLYAAAFAQAAQSMFWIVAAVCVLACLGTLMLPIRLSSKLSEPPLHDQSKLPNLDPSSH